MFARADSNAPFGCELFEGVNAVVVGLYRCLCSADDGEDGCPHLACEGHVAHPVQGKLAEPMILVREVRPERCRTGFGEGRDLLCDVLVECI